MLFFFVKLCNRVFQQAGPFVRTFNYLKMATITVVFHSFVLCLFYVSTAQVDVVTVPASPSIVMLWPLLRRSVATPVPRTAGI